MEPVELTESQNERLESIRAELSESVGAYATVTTTDVFEYVLDLADAVDDPDPQTGNEPSSWSSAQSLRRPFPRETLREQLAERNRKHGGEDASKEMDLYSIAASYDVTGRGSMTKDELVESILDTAERRYHDPFDQVDVEFPSTESADTEAGNDAEPTAPANDEERPTHADEPDQTADEESELDTTGNGDIETDDDGNHDTEAETAGEESQEAGDSDQLDAMLSLLETHDDKWWATDGDARYEVELPNGSIQTARTKDDVRAVLFRNY